MAVDTQKLKHVVRYICARCRPDPAEWSSPKLHAILWYADGYAYTRLGKAVVGEEYTRQAMGPMAVHVPAVLRELDQEGHLSAHALQDYFARGSPDPSLLNEEEKKILDEVIRDVTLDDSANSVRDVSHVQSWQIAQVGERLPYQQQLVARFRPLTDEDQQWIESQLEALR